MTLQMFGIFIHILCMLGAFGGLLIIQIGLPRDARESASVAGVAARPAMVLLLIGFLAGLYLYWLRISQAAAMGVELPSQEHMLIGTKFLLLLAAGGFMGATGKAMKRGAPIKAGRGRALAILSLALAALLAVRL